MEAISVRGGYSGPGLIFFLPGAARQSPELRSTLQNNGQRVTVRRFPES